MLIFSGIICGGLCAVITAARVFIRRLDEDVKKALDEVRYDVMEIVVDCVNCFIHTCVLYFAMLVFGVAADVALPAAMSVGAIKVFSSDNVHPTNYMHRTRRRFCRWWWCSEEQHDWIGKLQKLSDDEPHD